ncbi:MAG: hypothetical protein QM657_09405 [Lacrimispora sp.]|uniref:hypothetical protein n=1 Tax=Lacrimispora sp. TaxID=2719234 RepID=UPI0039E2C2B6
MINDEKIMGSERIEKLNRFTSIETGIYVEGELVQFQEALLFDDEIGIMLPVEFEDMEPEEAKRKYFSEQRPSIIKTNKEGTVDFSFNMIDQKIAAEDLEAVINDFHHVLKRFQPMSVCLEIGSEPKASIPCAWLEFISSALDENLYNVLTLYLVGDKLLMLMFNCPFHRRMDWLNCLTQIRKTVVLYGKGEQKTRPVYERKKEIC